MKNIRSLLSQNPMTFNELLDLFEAYVAAVREPILRGHNMLREEIGAGEHTALGHIFGVACDSEDMAIRLNHIRDARNDGSDVNLTLTAVETNRLIQAAEEIDIVLSAAGEVFELLHERADAENEDGGARAVMALAQSSLMEADERKMSVLRRFINKLHTEKLRLSAISADREGDGEPQEKPLNEEVSKIAAKLTGGDVAQPPKAKAM